MSLHPNPGVRADPLKQAGLKATLPRMRILEIFLAAQAAPDGLRHFTAEDVYRRMLHDRTDVGQATVYRVLAQLEQAGLLRRSSFQADRAVYELDDGCTTTTWCAWTAARSRNSTTHPSSSARPRLRTPRVFGCRSMRCRSTALARVPTARRTRSAQRCELRELPELLY